MENKLYQLYQMDWMMSHGYTMYDVMDAMTEFFQDEDNEVELVGLQSQADWFDKWLEEGNGFNGEIWASFDEFMDTEFKDAEYIHSLISSLPSDQQQELEEWYSAEHSKDEEIYIGEGIERIENILDDMGIKYDIKDNFALIEFWTDTAGQDIPVEIDYDGSVEDLVKQFVEYADNYDVDEKVELYVNSRGKNGVPESIRELTDDCQEAKDTLMEIAKKFEGALKNTVNYYSVTEYSNGAEHRWIFDESTLSKKMYNGGPVPESDGLDIGFPIGGSNSSTTWIEKCTSEVDIKDFLTMPADGPDNDDPMLVDIAEYYLHIDNDFGSCTDKFVKKFNLEYKDLNQSDDMYHHKSNAEKMITALKELGYKDFDFEDPFYGNNSDMTYDELYGLYKVQIIDKLGLDPDNLKSVSVNSAFNEDEKLLSVIVSFSTEEGDNNFICVHKQSSSTEFGLRLFGNTPRLINAESCTYDAEHLEQWTYKNENIWEYESLPRHKILEISQKDKLKPEEITTAILYYEHFNYGLFDSPADGHYSVPMVKQMIEDGFTKDRIAIIGKDYNAKEILKYPEVEDFYKKTRARLTKAGASVKNTKGH